MIYNLSLLNKKQEAEIKEIVGEPFSLFEKLSFGGTGSQAFLISEASEPIAGLLNKNEDLKTANIELRRSGIILGFRSRQDPYSWVIPFRKLSIYKTESRLSIHCDGLVVSLVPHMKKKLNQKFIRKLQEFKSNYHRSTRGPMDD